MPLARGDSNNRRYLGDLRRHDHLPENSHVAGAVLQIHGCRIEAGQTEELEDGRIVEIGPRVQRPPALPDPVSNSVRCHASSN